MSTLLTPFIIGGVPMSYPLMVGGGVCKHPHQALPYQRNDLPLGATEIGSLTPDPRSGNDGTLFRPPDWESFRQSKIGLNALGMPNIGFAEGHRILNGMSPKVPLLVNLAGFATDDFADGVLLFHMLPSVSAIVLNFGCSNAHVKKTVPIASDIGSVRQILRAVGSHGIIRVPVWIKLSPYLTQEELDTLAFYHPDIDFSHTPTVPLGFLSEILGLIAEFAFVQAIIFSNTLGNVVVRREDGQPATTPNGGQAGLSGSLLKPINLRLIRQARIILPERIDCVGCGGVLSGDDVVDYLEAGAAGVQYASGPFWYGNGARFVGNLLSDSERLQTYLAPFFNCV